MKKIKPVFLMLAFLLAAVATTQAQGVLELSSNAKIRKSADAAGDVVRIAPKDEVLRFGEEKDGWFSILDNSGAVIGYVSNQIGKASTAKPLELLSNAKIRKDPKADGAVVRIISKEDKLYYSGEKDGWFSIVDGTGAVIGYVSNQVAKGAETVVPATPDSIAAVPPPAADTVATAPVTPPMDSTTKKSDSIAVVVPPPAQIPDSSLTQAKAPDSAVKEASVLTLPDSQTAAVVAAPPPPPEVAPPPPPPPVVIHHPDSVVTRDSSYVVPGRAMVNDSAPVFTLPDLKSPVMRTAAKGDTLVFLNTVPVVVRIEVPAAPVEVAKVDSVPADSSAVKPVDSTLAKAPDTLKPAALVAAIPQFTYDTLYFLNITGTAYSQWAKVSDVSLLAKPETLHVSVYDTLNGDSLFAADSLARLMAAADSAKKAVPPDFMTRMKAFASKAKQYVISHPKQSIAAGGGVVVVIALAAVMSGGDAPGPGGTPDGGGGTDDPVISADDLPQVPGGN